MSVSPEIKALFKQYPKAAQEKLYDLRDFIFTVAKNRDLGEVTETIKWGEASYNCKGGTPIRIDWKDKHPENVSLYFNCQTLIAETIRTVVGNRLNVVGNREIRFNIKQQLPAKDICFCIDLALRYHSIKHLPLLGIEVSSAY